LSNQGERKCLLIDQHPVLGDASLYLGTGRHQYSFYELANNRDRLDEELLKGFLLHHPLGLDLLDAPEGVDAIYGASGPALEQTLAFLAEHYQFVLVDCPPGFSEGTLACIAQSSVTAIVMTADLPSVRNAPPYLDHLGKMGYPSTAYNRAQSLCQEGAISDDSVETTLSRPISVRVPNSYSEVIRAINTGAPITSDTKSDFSKAIRKWALDWPAAWQAKGRIQRPRPRHAAAFGLCLDNPARGALYSWHSLPSPFRQRAGFGCRASKSYRS